MDDTDGEIGTSNVNIKFKGTLNERLNDLYFVEALIKNEQLAINGYNISYSNFKLNDKHRDLFEGIKDLELLKQRLEYYGVRNDFEIDSMTQKDNFRISFLMDDKPSATMYKVDLTGLGILKLEVSNLSILLFVEKNMKEDYYKIKSYFKDIWGAKYISPETDEELQISQFVILDKNHLLVDNVDSENIIIDIKRNHSGNKNIEYVNQFLLEAIKAYDECSPQQRELSDLIYDLSSWLYNETEEDYIFINLAQVRYRLRILDEDDIKKMKDIANLNKDNIEMQMAVSILLDKKEEAKVMLSKMSVKAKEVFESYPIYNLLK